MISLLLMGWLFSSYTSYNLYKSRLERKVKEYGYYDKHGNLAASLFLAPLWLIITLVIFPYKSLTKEDKEIILATALIFIGSTILVLLNVKF